ncbi:sodium:proton antiporter [Prauserella sp. PE36]|uniref:Monovalent cation/H(+) antiporter subunit G n=1 Tax=Prauserella endophytica TaxID=1592324 RepID=A0ABY2RTH2_9PSEU|nr:MULTISPECIES: monovalent cation/H(+) antiporter subunit G [Prauserella]RBM13351.1 sodium:proton antiporter [Prauserella sp. PE36]TKG60028.1 monovalent cation/H(+) antiporter subunit G [Prauserella endophytica]
MTVRDWICAVLLLSGALFCLIGAYGVLRLPDVPSRLQAATKPQTLGLLLILAGTAVRLEPRYAVGLVLAGLFQVITAPVLSQLFGRTAYHTGAIEKSTLVTDELDERLRAERG